MEQEYNHTFNNLKQELNNLDTTHLKAKLEEQQEELFKSNAELFTGKKRVMYAQGMKFNIKKLHRIIAIIKGMRNDRSPAD